ncbi:hypothetical protein RHSIM_Rhsim05G0072800 [Rhododendron simsii]|uniref:40S ribosomal protein S25 n=1 Tax=Rhododendron simsii TaxID=118357 RepID=A0A834LPE9_RHOSS|nr:hypothetical protein RHSIM_Rhsim05G0072800 [Rhododendron simsii]
MKSLIERLCDPGRVNMMGYTVRAISGYPGSIDVIKVKQAPKKEKAPPPSSKPAKSGGGKQKKKLGCVVGDGFGVGLSKKLQKWSKGKQKEKVNNMVLFDKATYDKLLSEAPKYKLITPSILSDRLRVNGSLARKAIRDLMARGVIRMVSAHSSQQIYTRATNT